jgi:F-box/WD-40 domain protein 7
MNFTIQSSYISSPDEDSIPYLCPPSNPSGRRLDLADLMILCASLRTTSSTTELVVGSANHSLYAIDLVDSKKKPVELYGKKYGHTDWVSGVAHLADGRIISCGMDSKICLWSHDKRSCSEVHAHNGNKLFY